uniref:pyridoxamine 5'-phosphate oxidase family protein n=1 Tax=Pelomonas sp. KK5 TaxID=1855730 RepID=UPI0009F814CE
RPGFVTTPDARHMAIAHARPGDDPALALLATGAPVGLLGLEPQTRRRNRMNGVVESWPDGGALTIAVRQSFGNCPKYIVTREPQAVAPLPAAAQALGPALDEAALALIGRSDTLFIASASSRPGDGELRGEGVDVSHRGGQPGFIGIARSANGQVQLTLPDYPGNQFFMTLGNLSVNPKAGLLFVDYEGGGLLHLAADAELVWDAAQRFVRLTVREGVWRPGVLPWRWWPTNG